MRTSGDDGIELLIVRPVAEIDIKKRGSRKMMACIFFVVDEHLE